MSTQHTPDLSIPCVIWHGVLDQDGYGRVQFGSKWMMAHRKVFIDQHGLIPDGLVIDHLCRNRACVNAVR